jgi:putative (di)nucleoside polyphosphate hydrolase
MRDKIRYPNEPDLEELLSDPIVWKVMQSDHVEVHELRSLLQRVAADLAAGGAPGAQDQEPQEPDDAYRRGAGIMLLNGQNEVFVGRRINTLQTWQMPQGGIDEGEDPRAAALRELKEEIGTDNAEIIAESKNWWRYDLPPELVGQAWGGRWRGQQQKWFVMRFLGNDVEINLATEHPEFCEWTWVPVESLAVLVIPFKRQMYMDVVKEFTEAGVILSAHASDTTF